MILNSPPTKSRQLSTDWQAPNKRPFRISKLLTPFLISLNLFSVSILVIFTNLSILLFFSFYGSCWIESGKSAKIFSFKTFENCDGENWLRIAIENIPSKGWWEKAKKWRTKLINKSLIIRFWSFFSLMIISNR